MTAPATVSIASRIAELTEERDRLSRAIIAPNTIKGYGYDWKMWERWSVAMEMCTLPATPDSVSIYLTDLLTHGKKVSTTVRRASAIAHRHRAEGLASPVTPEIRAVLRGARRLSGERPRQMIPLSLAQLRAITTQLGNQGDAISIRDRSILVMGFASALRRCNLAGLLYEDLEIDDRGLILRIRREKQDRTGRGREIGLPRGKHASTCPVRCLTAWLDLRGHWPGPLFTRMDAAGAGKRLPLTGEAIAKTVKRHVARIGLDRKGYAGHSLRAGFITECGMAGIGELLIASTSGHRSMEVLRRYFRKSELFKANATGMLDL